VTENLLSVMNESERLRITKEMQAAGDCPQSDVQGAQQRIARIVRRLIASEAIFVDKKAE
jgi:flagellar motor switch protein FliG